MGKGPQDLGEKLIGSFLRKLCLEENKPSRIIFYNSGVKLIAEGSAVLDAIELLTKAGVEIIACGTCLNYFNLADKVEPEMIGDMQKIISVLMKPGDVVTI